MPKPGDLRVWWIPQVPMEAFHVSVPTKAEGHRLIKTLALYDIFQYDHSIKPDYYNAGGLHVYEDGEWVDVEDEDA